MGDEEHRPIVGRLERVLDDRGRGGRIEVRGRLVEHDDRRVREERSRERDPASLAAGDGGAVLPHERVPALGEALDPLPDPRAPQGGLDGLVVGARPRQPHVLEDRRGEQVGVLAIERHPRSDVLMTQGQVVLAAERHAAVIGVEEAHQQGRDRALARARRADQRDLPSGATRRSTSRSAHDASSRVREADALERDGRIRRQRRRFGRLEDRRPSPGDLEQPLARSERLTELERRRRERNDALERRHREQRHRRHEHTVQGSDLRRVDAEGEHADHGEPGDDHAEPFDEAACDRAPSRATGELAVQFLDPCDGIAVRSQDEELGTAAEDVDELGGELGAHRPPAPLGTAARRDRERRDADATDEQARREDRARGRHEQRRDHDRDDADHDRDERRRDAAQEQVLHRVDVAHHAGEEVAAPVPLDAGRDLRLEGAEEGATETREHAERKVVRLEPVEIAGDRPPDAARAHRGPSRR